MSTQVVDPTLSTGTENTGTQTPTRSLGVSLFPVGVFVSLTIIFAPIHELGHVIVGGEMIAWNQTQPTEWDARHIWAGYWSEMTVWGGLACLFVRFRAFSWFSLGCAVGAYLHFYIGTDLYNFGVQLMEREGVSVRDIGAAILEIKIRWGVITGPALLATPAILRYAYRL